MFYTIEHYPGPTAGEAMQRIKRKERNERMNAGKRFEADWRESIAKAENVWYYRFRDSPATYYGGAQDGIRFAADNICDCLVYAYPCLHLFELKTVETPSASLTALFGEFDPEKRLYKKTPAGNGPGCPVPWHRCVGGHQLPGNGPHLRLRCRKSSAAAG